MAIFQQALNSYQSFQKEGDFNPKNRGGTKYGINYYFLKSIDKHAQKEDIQSLSYDKAVDICFQYFWLNTNYYQLSSQNLANLLFSTSLDFTERFALNTLNKVIFKVINQDIFPKEIIVDMYNILLHKENMNIEEIILENYKDEILKHKNKIEKISNK